MRNYVSIGGPIALLVLGAILKFALATTIPGVNLGMVGLIAMIAGVVWLGAELALNGRRKTTVRENVSNEDGTMSSVEQVRTED